MSTKSYAHPEVLVDTNWVVQHHKDSNVRIAEVDYDPTSNYNQGHIPDAVLFDWKKDINEPVKRDILTQQQFEALFSRNGISDHTTLVLYGDFNNWFAAFAFWVFKYYGVKDIRVMNSGRKKWIEEDKPLTKDVPSVSATSYKVSKIDEKLRVYLHDVREALGKKHIGLVDVRGPKEYLLEKFLHRQNIRRNTPSEEDTSPARKTFLGVRQSRKTELSRPLKSWRISTSQRELLQTRKSSRTAGLARDRPTRGLS